MQDFPEFINNDNTINNSTVFEKLFTAPQRTFAFIHGYKFEKYLVLIAILNGISSAVARAAEQKEGDTLPLWGIILLSIAIGSVFGYITLLFYSFVTNITGGWLKGTAGTNDIMRVLTYSMVPSLLKLVMVAFKMVVFGKAIFSSDFYISDYSALDKVIYYGTTLVIVVVSVWSVVLFVLGLAEVQKFSIGKAILNVLLPVVIMMGIALVLFVAIDLFGH